MSFASTNCAKPLPRMEEGTNSYPRFTINLEHLKRSVRGKPKWMKRRENGICPHWHQAERSHLEARPVVFESLPPSLVTCTKSPTNDHPQAKALPGADRPANPQSRPKDNLRAPNPGVILNIDESISISNGYQDFSDVIEVTPSRAHEVCVGPNIRWSPRTKTKQMNENPKGAPGESLETMTEKRRGYGNRGKEKTQESAIEVPTGRPHNQQGDSSMKPQRREIGWTETKA
ncbi:hypothetical protein DFP72DRAFT_855519 [Ephemerocybe angulata]|uniref:Uncharacterized protein n=1 Tax=Ephemerocybe angulata TaxID=980116 RepID=A0A8H6HH30_9AGAR|nr:hypothetical protein DFP72DRAFT_855519 [Tulosesus angulatus]